MTRATRTDQLFVRGWHRRVDMSTGGLIHRYQRADRGRRRAAARHERRGYEATAPALGQHPLGRVLLAYPVDDRHAWSGVVLWCQLNPRRGDAVQHRWCVQLPSSSCSGRWMAIATALHKRSQNHKIPLPGCETGCATFLARSEPSSAILAWLSQYPSLKTRRAAPLPGKRDTQLASRPVKGVAQARHARLWRIRRDVADSGAPPLRRLNPA